MLSVFLTNYFGLVVLHFLYLRCTKSVRLVVLSLIKGVRRILLRWLIDTFLAVQSLPTLVKSEIEFESLKLLGRCTIRRLISALSNYISSLYPSA